MGSTSIYKHMYDDKQCTGLSAFYKQWAEELELAGNYAEARRILVLGIEAKAKPEDDLCNFLK